MCRSATASGRARRAGSSGAGRACRRDSACGRGPRRTKMAACPPRGDTSPPRGPRAILSLRRDWMRFHTYSKYSPELADAVDLQSLLDQLADFLLQSGFAGGKHVHPYWGEFGGEEEAN